MSLISRLTPRNIQEEKEKFFADNSYNPQFLYDETPTPSDMYKYGKPDQDLAKRAKYILEKTYQTYSEAELSNLDGRLLSKDEVEEGISNFLSIHDLEDRYTLHWSSSYISRTTISKNKILLRLPNVFKNKSFAGMLYHEIGTHALRRINYEQQPWFKKKKKYGFESYLQTEEGIAVLHSLIPQSYKVAYKPARYYYACFLAQQKSFAETWEALIPFVPDIEKRWTTVLRQKRGLTDTSMPGGFTKDLVYFQGFLEVSKWLQAHDYALEDLYLGKMSLNDVTKARELNPTYQAKLPYFYHSDKLQYISNIKEIIKANE